MFKRQLFAISCGVLICGAISVPARASFVNGIFGFGGTSIEVTANDIIFYNLPSLTPSTGTPSGNFEVLPPATGSFTGTAGEIGTVGNLTRTTADSPPYAFAPADTTVAIMDWMVLPTQGIDFELTTLASGETQHPGTPVCSTLSSAALAAAGTTCVSDPTSPFLLTNIADPTSTGGIDTTFTLTASGLDWFATTPTQQSTFIADLGGSIVGQNIGQVLSTLATTGQITTPIQGMVSSTAAIPEPSSAYLVVGALLGIVGLALRYTSRRSC